MKNPIRKFIGTIALLVFIASYALLVMALAPPVVASPHTLVHVGFFAVAGLAWTIPAGAIIWWMARPSAGDHG